ncbi:MAG TPA: hypothetical protein VEL51_09065 [Vicinamibacterales bacterium]|nr:hypothetical protein [Vicinamibacterales bacterium]
MYRSTNRWSTAVAAAALIALPVVAAAQTTGTTPQQQPPAQTQPQQTQPPQTPPQQTTPPAQPSPSQPSATGRMDQAAAKQHLSEARDALSQLTSMPEAAKLQGDARTQVSQLISNFNELITAQANWRASYDKVNANLTTLLGPDTSDPNAPSATGGAVGTAGAAGIAGLDPAIRTKLAEVRTHLKMFEQSAGGTSSPSPTEPRPGDTTGGMAPAAATGSTGNPANPATPTGTSGVTPSPTANMNPADQTKASEQVGHAEADKHLDAISAILNSSKSGTLTRAQTAELKKHVAELRRILQEKQ